MRKLVSLVLASVLSCGLLIVWGCHADPDDAAGQAEELEDPVRRENAVANIHRLYTSALARHDGDRANSEVKSIADATIEKLVRCYIDHPEDTQNGQTIINLLSEMQDPRGIPALIEAMGWRSEVTEDHAIRAAQTFKSMEIPDGDKGAVIEAVAGALERVTGARGVDNRMRIEFIRTLGALNDQRATTVLTKIATTQSEEQNFLINRLAAEQVGRIGDAESVPAMVNGLFLFAPSNPAMRMNDVAAEALVRIGRPSYAPLVQVLEGNCEECNAIAEQYIEAVRQRNAEAAAQMSVEMLTNAEATFTLGALGFRDALDPIMALTEGENKQRVMQSTIAIVRLNLEPSDLPRVRETLRRVYGEVEDPMKPQLIAAIRHLYDSEMQTFFMDLVQNRNTLPLVRVEAVKAFALLANKEEAERMRALIAREPSSAAERNQGDKEAFEEQANEALAAAIECDESIECWIGKLDDDDDKVVTKAAYTLGRFGRGNAAAISALVAKLDHREITVRLAVLTALDRIAVDGSQEGVDAIERLRETEEGRSVWTNFRREALPTQARLRNRIDG